MRHVSQKPVMLFFSVFVCLHICLSIFSHDHSSASHHFIIALSNSLLPVPLSSYLSLLTSDQFIASPRDSTLSHPQFSVIELRGLRTLVLRFNLLWPEQWACMPSLYGYIRGMGWHHHGNRDWSDPERNHPNAPQQRASNRIRGYGNDVEGWLRFQ